MKQTYHRQTRKLSDAGHTFRKNMLDEDPTFTPRISDKGKFLQRTHSTGNISVDLYNEAAQKRKRDKFKANESIMSARAS